MRPRYHDANRLQKGRDREYGGVQAISEIGLLGREVPANINQQIGGIT